MWEEPMKTIDNITHKLIGLLSSAPKCSVLTLEFFPTKRYSRLLKYLEINLLNANPKINMPKNQA